MKSPSRIQKIGTRILKFLLLCVVIGCVTRVMIAVSTKSDGPAGFGRGVVHGALMPCALPNLLVGNDVTIYAPLNTGRTYKLGYTVGVNSCGAIFFGFFFWRLNRWRKLVRNSIQNPSPAQ